MSFKGRAQAIACMPDAVLFASVEIDESDLAQLVSKP
jgi:hypothetical protein